MIRFLTAGESHGKALTIIVDGFPSNLKIAKDYINSHLKRRQVGYGRGLRMKIESDAVEILLFLIIMLTILQIKIKAQENSWYQTNGPYGGDVGSIVIDSTGNLFAGSGQGIYKSTNDGLSWSIIAFKDTNVGGLVINSKGYMFAYMGLFTGFTPSSGCYGIYRSTDGGNSWSKLTTGYDSSTRVSIIVISKEGILFAGQPNYPNSSLICSSDEGNTWKQISLEGRDDTYALIFGKDSTLYLGQFSAGIFRSTDKGNTWVKISSLYCTSLARDSAKNIIAGTQTGIYVSTDDGLTWKPRGLQDKILNTLFIDSQGNIFAGTRGQGLYESTDNGNTWIHKELISGIVNCLTIKPAGDIYAGTTNNTVYKSTDNGNNWTQLCTGFINSVVNSPVIESKDSILAPCVNGLFRSTNNGDSWEKIAFRDTAIRFLYVDRVGRIFACPNYFIPGILWSTDHGVSWQHSLKNHYINCVSVDISNNFYAGTDSGLFRSTDGGNNWTNNGLITGSVSSILTTNDKTILACNFTSVYRSTNYGENWTEVLLNVSPSVIKMDSQGTIYEAGYGVYRSTDNGISWSYFPFKYQLSLLAINSLGYIFVGAFDEGVIRSTDQGNTWTDFSGIMWYEYLKGLGVDSKDNLYAGTSGHGVFRTTKTTPVTEKTNSSIRTFSLSQNYPNPFNPTTTIKYTIKESSVVKISVYDIMGRQIKTIVNERKEPGYYESEFGGMGLASGVYFYTMKAGNYSSTKKMIVIK